MARRKKKRLLNVVGPQIRKRRYELGLTQERLAAKCQLRGWDISRATLSQIEAQLRCVRDSELLLFSQVLKSRMEDLFPAAARRGRQR